MKKTHELGRRSKWRNYKKVWQLYVVIAIPLLYLAIFKYYPMLGAQIAFKNFRPTLGIWGSPWVGLKHFSMFINSRMFDITIRNTLVLNVMGLILTFPAPILLALTINYVNNRTYAKTVQLVSYAPHFISMVVMVGIIMQFLAPRTGAVGKLLTHFAGETINIMGIPRAFRWTYVLSGIWQSVGYSSIIYISVLSTIPVSIHEAAIMDGASKPMRMWFIDLPGLMPTAVILLIMNTGQLLNSGFEKVLLLQNDLNLQYSEVIDTYVYKIGFNSSIPNFSYATAIGLFKSVLGMVLLVLVNKIAKNLNQTTLW